MFKNFSTILEIGSSKLKVMVASKGINHTFNITESAEKEYDGYFAGNFIDESSLLKDLKQLFEEVDYIKNKYNKKITVGLPSEFLSVDVVSVSVGFEKYKKIKQDDLEKVFVEAVSKVERVDSEIISTSIISISLDDGGRVLSSPVGKKAKQISADVSVISCSKNKIKMFNEVFSKLNFASVEYVSEALVSSTYVIEENDREEVCLFVDIGHLTTTVAFVKGEGITNLKTFSFGGGFITNELSNECNLDYVDADNLKKQVVVSLKGLRGDNYDVVTQNGLKRLNLINVNKTVLKKIEEISMLINREIQNYSNETLTFLPIYLSGLGITKIKGGKDALGKFLGRNITLALPTVPGQDKTENIVSLSILNYCLNDNKN